MFSKFVEDFYHVIMRNGNQQPIFLDDADKMEYLKILRAALKRHGGRLFVFLLMITHTHQLIKCREIDAVWKEVYCGYSGYFARRHGKYGRLIDWPVGVYKVSSLQKLISDVIYILNNSVKAGLCKRVSDFKFCSFSFYFSKKVPLKKYIDVDVSLVRDAFKTSDRLTAALRRDLQTFRQNLDNVQDLRRSRVIL
jgi:hypothetical protein